MDAAPWSSAVARTAPRSPARATWREGVHASEAPAAGGGNIRAIPTSAPTTTPAPVLTPYPGTLTGYELKKANRIVSFDWTKYDQANVVYRPAQMTGDQLRLGQTAAYEQFYSVPSMAKRFPVLGARKRTMKKGAATDRKDAVAEPTPVPDVIPMPPILPLKREWREAVLEGTAGARME